ncbi:cobalamin biosynthesis protein CobQ [Pseudoroseicyclus sp. CXY001]|uniref:cobalamin biosynthesis protein CobQ n=1 Tax=Pseudoroseicyclus sp. CXY001 TaxID=3242492 RepID=UPI003570987F
MNTPAHMALSLAVLGRSRPGRLWWVILAGALLPDLAYFIRHLAPGFDGPLDLAADIFNSAPLYAALLAVGLLSRLPWLTLLTASALLHIAFDLPLHAGDAHSHFWPFTDWAFESPFSFWDERHYGRLFGSLEGVLFALAFLAIWRRLETGWQRALALFGALIYVATFVHFVGHAWAGAHWAIW